MPISTLSSSECQKSPIQILEKEEIMEKLGNLLKEIERDENIRPDIEEQLPELFDSHREHALFRALMVVIRRQRNELKTKKS